VPGDLAGPSLTLLVSDVPVRSGYPQKGLCEREHRCGCGFVATRHQATALSMLADGLSPTQPLGSGTGLGRRVLRLVRFIQTVRHRDYFLAVEAPGKQAHAPPPSNSSAVISASFARSLHRCRGPCQIPHTDLGEATGQADVPKAVVGIVIATLMPLPEGLAAVRAARANRLQTGLNLALESALASIGLTILAVAAATVVLGQPLELELHEKDSVRRALTVLSVITLGTGRITVLQGIVHLVILAMFSFFAAVP